MQTLAICQLKGLMRESIHIAKVRDSVESSRIAPYWQTVVWYCRICKLKWREEKAASSAGNLLHIAKWYSSLVIISFTLSVKFRVFGPYACLIQWQKTISTVLDRGINVLKNLWWNETTVTGLIVLDLSAFHYSQSSSSHIYMTKPPLEANGVAFSIYCTWVGVNLIGIISSAVTDKILDIC